MRLTDLLNEDRYTDKEREEKRSGKNSGRRGQNRTNNTENRRAGLSAEAELKWKKLSAMFKEMSPQDKKDFVADKPIWSEIKELQRKAGKDQATWEKLHDKIMTLSANLPEQIAGKKEEREALRNKWIKTIEPVAGLELGEIKALGKKVTAALRKQAFRTVADLTAEAAVIVKAATEANDANRTSDERTLRNVGKRAVNESLLREFREMNPRQKDTVDQLRAGMVDGAKRLEPKGLAEFVAAMKDIDKIYKKAVSKNSAKRMNDVISKLNGVNRKYGLTKDSKQLDRPSEYFTNFMASHDG